MFPLLKGTDFSLALFQTSNCDSSPEEGRKLVLYSLPTGERCLRGELGADSLALCHVSRVT